MPRGPAICVRDERGSGEAGGRLRPSWAIADADLHGGCRRDGTRTATSGMQGRRLYSTSPDPTRPRSTTPDTNQQVRSHHARTAVVELDAAEPKVPANTLFLEMERAGLEPATSGLQSSLRPSGLHRHERGLPARAGISSVALRGSPGLAGAFRPPRAGCRRDETVVSLQNKVLTSIRSACRRLCPSDGLEPSTPFAERDNSQGLVGLIRTFGLLLKRRG